MGRKRTTGCTARHDPDDPCRPCAAWRAVRSRLKKRDAKAREEKLRQREARKAARRLVAGQAVVAAAGVEADEHLSPEERARLELDDAAAEHRARGAAARGYVAVYRRRGLLRPPDACERCGIGERLTRWSVPTPLIPWHPDPSKPREIAWFCAPCRVHVRAAREPLTLRWVWPGGLPVRTRGRPRKLMPSSGDASAWRTAALAAGEAAAARATLPGLAAELFLHAFLVAAGPERVDALYDEGVRGGDSWRPVGDPKRDAVVRAWAERERVERCSEERVVQPIAAWERRARHDRLPQQRAAKPEVVWVPSTPAVLEAHMAEAVEQLGHAEAEVDAMLARVTAALEQDATRRRTTTHRRPAH